VGFAGREAAGTVAVGRRVEYVLVVRRRITDGDACLLYLAAGLFVNGEILE
jgi:hypothetical protein